MDQLTSLLSQMKNKVDQIPNLVQHSASTSAFQNIPHATSLHVNPTSQGVKFVARGPHAQAVAKNSAVRTRKSIEESMRDLRLK
jgi:hypothetical protein